MLNLPSLSSAVLPLVDTLKDDSLSAAKMAMRFLVNLSRFPPDTRAQYFDNEIRSRLEALASGGRAQNRLRVYEVAVDIAKRSREHLIWIGDFDILPRLVEEIRSVDDPLSAAGALEVATGLTETQWGLQWLEQRAVLREIDGQLANIAASDFASLLLPRFVEFMGGSSFKDLVLKKSCISRKNHLLSARVKFYLSLGGIPPKTTSQSR